MNSIEWKPKATRQFLKIRNRKARKNIARTVTALQEFPNVRNVKALKNRNDYRLRVGRYRVIFTVADSVKIITIEEVKKRNEQTY